MHLLLELAVQQVEMGQEVEREPDIQQRREGMEMLGMEVTRAAEAAAQVKRVPPVSVVLVEMAEAE